MSNLAYKVQQRQHDTKQSRVERQTPSVQQVKHKITKVEKFLWAVAVVGLLLSCIFVVSNYAHLYHVNSEVQQLESKVETQRKQNSNLDAKASQLSEPQRIMRVAEEKLGMTFNNKNVETIQN